MKIRGKLLTLILIPLLAVGTAAVWGFRTQSVETEQAEAALAQAEATSEIHRVVIAYGDERLALFASTSTSDLEALRSETDAALAAAGLSSDSVEAARAAIDREAAVTLYSEAIAALLEQPIVLDGYEAEQVLTTVAVQTAFELLEARETAWFGYIAAAEVADGAVADGAVADGAVADADQPPSVVPVIVALSEATARAEETRASAGVQNEPGVIEASQSEAERALGNLGFLAINELADGQPAIATDAIVSALVDARAEWADAVVAADLAVQDDIRQTLDDANGVRSLFSLLGVVGMVVLAGLVFVIYRSIVHPLQHLVDRARSVADEELPELVHTLRRDDHVEDLPEPILIPVTNDDEIGQLVEAFNEVQITAHGLATEQALGRKNVADMYVNLGRRNQQLLQRILGLLTDLERDEEDPDTLRDLFVLDNIVTRMRRNAESLVVLAGGQTPRQWSDPVSLEDTVRSALSEVEGYERVDIAALAEVRLPGGMVADIAHLLAELIENAATFSDPTTPVLVGGHFEDDGYVVTIFDQGIGMSEAELDLNNRRISDPPPLDQAPSKFLGLFVVGRLADRHDITVRLQKAPGRGVMARVLIPDSVVIVEEGVDTEPVDSELAEVELAEAFADGSVSGELTGDAAPLGPEVDDLDEVLAGVGTDEVPDAAPPEPPIATTPESASTEDGLEALPVRRRGATLGTPPPPEPPTPTTDSDGDGDADGDDDLFDLPMRVRGDALGETAEAEPGARPQQKEAIGEEAAGSFSSLMSAFSSGVSRGLEDTALDSLDEGDDR